MMFLYYLEEATPYWKPEPEVVAVPRKVTPEAYYPEPTPQPKMVPDAKVPSPAKMAPEPKVAPKPKVAPFRPEPEPPKAVPTPKKTTEAPQAKGTVENASLYNPSLVKALLLYLSIFFLYL